MVEAMFCEPAALGENLPAHFRSVEFGLHTMVALGSRGTLGGYFGCARSRW